MDFNVDKFSNDLRKFSKLKQEDKINKEYMEVMKNHFKALYQNHKDHEEIIKEKWAKLWNMYVGNPKPREIYNTVDEIEFDICRALGIKSGYMKALERFDNLLLGLRKGGDKK